MEIELTPEQVLIEKAAKDFVIREASSLIQDQDVKEIVNKEILKRMGECGFLGMTIPKKYGGQGMDYISLGLTCLQFEKIDSSLRFVLTVHLGLNSTALLIWGTEEQKKKYLLPQSLGKKIGAFGACEPNAGSDISGMQTTAIRQGDYYVLNGEKTWITLADLADNFLIFADVKNEKEKSVSAFIVERDLKGVSTSPIKGKLGVRAQNVGSVSLQNVKVPKENLLGKEGDGIEIIMSALDNGLYTVASGAVGTIESCLETSVKYAHERETFGKEIGGHELVQQMIAQMSSSRDIGRLLIYNSGWLKNTGRNNRQETFLAKLINCKNAFEAANNALQILGAYGYCNEFNVERHLRNAKGSMIYGLPHEIHLLIQADYALGYRS